MTGAQLSLLRPVDELHRARLEFQQRIQSGEPTLCPCCGRTAKLYRRRLHSGMARDLVELYRLTLEREASGRSPRIDWSELWHANRRGEATTGNEFSKLQHWELIEKLPATKAEDGAELEPAGWVITAKGRRFVQGRIRVPRHCYLLDNKRQRFSEDSTSIAEALGEPFDLEELLGAWGLPV